MTLIGRQVEMHSGKLTLRNAHCSAPPLRASFHLPRLSREAEAVLRPRAPLRPTKREVRESEASSVEFSLGEADAVKVKVEADVGRARPAPAVRATGGRPH